MSVSLIVSTRLHKRVCLFIGPLVGPSKTLFLGGQKRATYAMYPALFLDASTHLYKRVSLSVRPLVRWSVGPSVMLLSASRNEPANDLFRVYKIVAKASSSIDLTIKKKKSNEKRYSSRI